MRREPRRCQIGLMSRATDKIYFSLVVMPPGHGLRCHIIGNAGLVLQAGDEAGSPPSPAEHGGLTPLLS